MATTSVVRVPGDYLIQASTGGVVIDVTNTTTIHSATLGTVSIYGNLNVFGTQTFIETTNTNITDNILVLNGGETNNYVSAGTAGIAISRSNDVEDLTNSASFLFDDTKTWSYDNVTTYQGLWELSVGTTGTTALTVNALRVNPAVNFLNFLGKENPLAVLNVKGTTNYEQQVLNDDDIPNKKYVDDRFFVGNELARKLKVGNTQIQINDNSVAPSDPYYNIQNKITASLGDPTNVVLNLQGIDAQVQGLTINDTNIIVNPSRSSNSIQITPATGGTVKVNSSLGINYSNSPGATANYTHVYTTSTAGGGGTGIYFVNTVRQDELVSRKRAIIYGIIF